MENDISCIYKITNLIDNKIYIGSTKNLRKRKIKHISKLNLNYHHNSFLQKDYNTYGSLIENQIKSLEEEPIRTSIKLFIWYWLFKNIWKEIKR